MQGSHQRSCFSFAIPNDHRDDQVGIVKSSAKSVGHAIAQFAAFVDGTRRLWSAVTADTSRKRELLKESAHASCILGFVEVNLRVCSFEVGVCEGRRGSVPGARNVDHVQIVFFDQPVQVDPNETLTRVRSPMPDQTLLEVFHLEWLSEQWVFA